MASFLHVFKTASDVLCGSNYSTIDLILLFRAEVATVLEASERDSAIVKQLKRNMMNRLDYRFSVNKINVCAAMLDPSQRNLPAILEYLLEKNITAVQFLSQMIEKHVSNASAPVHQKEAASSLLLSEAERPWKKAKLDMLSKHITTVDSIEREIQQFRCLPIITDDKFA